VWGVDAFSSTLSTFSIMQNSTSLAIEQTNIMHNAPTHNKEDALLHTKTNRLNFKLPKPKINKSKVKICWIIAMDCHGEGFDT